MRGLKYLNVGAFYRPDYTDTYLDNLNSSIDSISRNTPHIWLRGDFNLPSIDWESESTTPACKDISLSNKMLFITADNNHTQIQHQPLEKKTISIYY